MADTELMPKLGFDMQEGTLIRWVKVENEQVNKGDVLAEIETDKATVEVAASFSGVVLRQLVGEGDVVPVGSPIAIIGQPGEELPQAASVPAAAPAAKGQSEQAAQAESAQPAEVETSAEEGRIKASPLARRMASENEIDLRGVKGSGSSGRIVRADVENAIEAAQSVAFQPAPSAAQAVPASAPAPVAKSQEVPAAPAPVWSGLYSAPQDEVIKVNRLRAIIGKRMVESKTQIPHFYVTRSYKFEELMQLRSQLNSYLPDDQKISVNDFIIKAVALTLRQFPNVNASLRGDEVVRYGHVNIGSAVSVEGGLMTVVVKDADQKPLRLISNEMRELVARARQGKVRPADIEGSTFSVSNLGMYDVDHFVAIINPPEVGILAVGSAMQVPVVEDGELKVGTRMKATISIDHRVSDGAEAARFMQTLAGYLEKPVHLVL